LCPLLLVSGALSLASARCSQHGGSRDGVQPDGADVTHPEADGPSDGATPRIALLDCGPDEAATQVAALVNLAERLGLVVRREDVSATCTTVSARLTPESVQRFQAALLLGGATILPTGSNPETNMTVIVTISARPARRE
jgi:hypothetical protein